MIQPKRLHTTAIPAALERAEKYRLLNEPYAAESICRDILEVQPDDEQARIMLILVLTDQFERHVRKPIEEARVLVQGLDDEYQRYYYTGLVLERQAKALLRRAAPGSGPVAYDGLRQAMERYEKAEQLSPEGNDEALLRWNTCARIINDHDHVEPHGDSFVPLLE